MNGINERHFGVRRSGTWDNNVIWSVLLANFVALHVAGFLPLFQEVARNLLFSAQVLLSNRDLEARSTVFPSVIEVALDMAMNHPPPQLWNIRGNQPSSAAGPGIASS